MAIWRSVVGKLWMTIIGLVALVLIIMGVFLEQFAENAHIKIIFIYVAAIGFLLVTFFAFFLSTRITRPLLNMKKAANLITLGEYRTRVPVSSTDEIGLLAKTFNHMAEQLEETIDELHHEKEHLYSVLRSMTDAVITFDADGKVILTNPQGERIIREWGDYQWKGNQHLSENGTLIPEPLQSLFNSVVREATEISTKLDVHNGVWSIVMTPLYSQELMRGAVAVLRNITEEFRLDKLRKDFVANVSHEIRTPLSMLQGYSEALLDDIANSPEERREIVQVIYEESLRMGRLVKDLLDMARMEAGHIELDLGEVDLLMLIQRVCRKFAVLCKEQEITLIQKIDQEDLSLDFADADRLEQVFTNLLDNAIRHSKSHSSIYLRAHPIEFSGQPYVQIEVEDEGQGIPQEDLPYIFERFYKADKARTRGANRGTGLGLSIVKNIIEAQHGTISAQSVVGQGTLFTIMMPRKPHEL